jgi:CRISPR-associated protein Cmr5
MGKKKGKPSHFTRPPGSAPAASSPPRPSPAPASTQPAPGPSGPVVLRDQERARFAYERVAAVPQAERDDYENAVLGLGADILRVGLLAALAAVQRLEKRGERLLDDLAAAKIPGLGAKDGAQLVERARELDVDGYMIATRETLALVSWLRRACQATFEDRG